MLMPGPKIKRATAMVQHRSSIEGSGASRIFVPCLARKFCTMISWICPWRSASSRSASSASMRSRRVSPIPIRMPVVNGTRISPARRIVSRRRAGSLSGEPKCGPPRLRQALGGGFQHDAHGRCDRAQHREVHRAHQAGIQHAGAGRCHPARAARPLAGRTKWNRGPGSPAPHAPADSGPRACPRV